MAYTVDTNTRTPLSQLREGLDKAERLVVQVDGKSIAQFLTLLDNIDQQFENLGKGSPDLLPEQSRWEGILNRVNNQPDPIVHAANVAGGMDKLRAENPPAESFWWHLDSEVTRRRLRSARRMIVTLITVVVVVVGGYWAINYFFPPNPEAVLMVETTNGIDRLIVEERWQEALDLVKSARLQLPNSAELILWEAVLYERMGKNEAAAASITEAQQLLVEQPVQVYIYLGNNRLRVNDLEGAKAAGEQALAINPNEPQAYFLLGGVAETAGDVAMAIDYFDKTYELAETSSPQLAVIARVRMGQLMQNPGSISPSATSVITPTAAP